MVYTSVWLFACCRWVTQYGARGDERQYITLPVAKREVSCLEERSAVGVSHCPGSIDRSYSNHSVQDSLDSAISMRSFPQHFFSSTKTVSGQYEQQHASVDGRFSGGALECILSDSPPATESIKHPTLPNFPASISGPIIRTQLRKRRGSGLMRRVYGTWGSHKGALRSNMFVLKAIDVPRRFAERHFCDFTWTTTRKKRVVDEHAKEEALYLSGLFTAVVLRFPISAKVPKTSIVRYLFPH